MTPSETFDAARLKTPETIWHPVFLWAWNSKITREGIRKQIDSFPEYGIRGVYIVAEPATFRPVSMPTSLSPEFNTGEYYELYRYAAEYAIEKGLVFWLYDEPGWPSGSAHGLVVKANPDLELQGIMNRSLLVKAGKSYKVPKDVLASFTWDDKRVSGSFTAKEDTAVIEYYAEKQKNYSTPYPNLIDSRSTETLIKVCFEKYKKHLGHLFGKGIQLVFIDEPGVTSRPWTAGFEEAFRKRFGYELRDYLPAIMESVMQGEKGIQARIDYYDLSSELFARNYFLRQKKWCNENNLLLIGHIGGEDRTRGCLQDGYLHLLRNLRAMDVPGIDAIWRQIFPGKEKNVRILSNDYQVGRNHFFPRYASSAANQTGSRFSFTESGGVYGMGFTFEEHRFVTFFQMVRGISIVSHICAFSSSKDHFMGAEPPNYAKELPQCWDLSVYNEYIARACYIMSLGPIAVDTALYMPIRDIWADESVSSDIVNIYEETAFRLEKLQCYFDIIDDDVILAADKSVLERGELRMGLAAYKTVYIPVNRHMTAAVKEKLKTFIAGGGKVYITGKLPGERIPFLTIAGAQNIDTEALKENVLPVAEVSPFCEAIRILKRGYKDKGSIYLVFNESTEKISLSIGFNEKLPAYEADLLSGNLVKVNCKKRKGKAGIPVDLSGGEGRIFIFTGEELPALPDRRAGAVSLKTFSEINRFNFRRTKRFTIGKNHYSLEAVKEEPKPVEIGDWRAAAGDDFSGSAEYTAQFAKPFEHGTVYIDLGEVKYVSEVFINGASVGVRCMPPHVYAVEVETLKDENMLNIRVTNTGANEFVAKDKMLMKKYTMRRLGSYYVTGIYFARDSLPSGLIGPVRICGVCCPGA